MKKQIYSNTTSSAEFTRRPHLGHLPGIFGHYEHTMFVRDIARGRETLL